jgi:hypothetical protein
VEQETNGYEDVAAKDLPAYRVVHGHPEFFNPMRGWCPLLTHDEWLAGIMSTAYLFQPIGELEQLGFAAQSAVAISRTNVGSIVERVRNLILDWSLELESAGVLGEGMGFTLNEKTKALAVTNNYFAQNIGVAGNVEGGSTVQNNQVAGAALDLEAVRGLLQQMQHLAPILPPNLRAAVEADAADLQAETTKSQPDQGRVRKLLGSIRTTCEGASGNLVATGVVEAIKAMLS